MKSSGVTKTNYGYELLWASDETYSGKILTFEKAGTCTDMIFHKEKRKSIFVNNGQIKLRWIDTKTGELKEAILNEGQTINIVELQPHQFEAITDNSSLTEVGSSELENDIFIVSTNSIK